MGLEVTPEEPNRCVRGCCRSAAIPLHLPAASFSLLSPIARGSESTVYEARLGGERAAAKKPVLSTSDDLDKFHYQLQLLCELDHPDLQAEAQDHVASCPMEGERVVKEGIEVRWQIDTWRVGAAALQVTRSIGDDDLKPAVTARPEIIETDLSADD